MDSQQPRLQLNTPDGDHGAQPEPGRTGAECVVGIRRRSRFDPRGNSIDGSNSRTP